MTDEIINPPDVITPLESGYIRAAIAAVLPAINWIIYSTNLDVALHITKLTTNQVWQGVNAALIVFSVYKVIRKRIKDGNDPTSTAQKIVLRKPPPPTNEFQQIVDGLAESPPEIIKTISEMPKVSADEAMKEIDEYAESLKAKKP